MNEELEMERQVDDQTVAVGNRAGGREPWQLRLFRHSIKKKETMRAVLSVLPDVEGKRCLEIGCATGTSGWLLRQRGGTWSSSDFDIAQVESARELLQDDVVLLEENRLPFGDDEFDVVVGINFLEHLEHDEEFVREMARVLKPGGTFILTCPDAATNRLGYQVKKLYKFTADTGGFGHVRDGYVPPELRALVERSGLEVESLQSYSRIFTEMVENTLNFFYHRSAAESEPEASEEDTAGQFHGETSPASGDDFKAVGWKFRLYEMAYPLLRGFSLLDRVIPFRPGYMYCVRARKTLPAA
jgi:SAM-dependent methyltransferase